MGTWACQPSQLSHQTYWKLRTLLHGSQSVFADPWTHENSQTYYCCKPWCSCPYYLFTVWRVISILGYAYVVFISLPQTWSNNTCRTLTLQYTQYTQHALENYARFFNQHFRCTCSQQITFIRVLFRSSGTDIDYIKLLQERQEEQREKVMLHLHYVISFYILSHMLPIHGNVSQYIMYSLHSELFISQRWLHTQSALTASMRIKWGIMAWALGLYCKWITGKVAARHSLGQLVVMLLKQSMC